MLLIFYENCNTIVLHFYFPMRSVLSVSLPAEIVSSIQAKAKKLGMSVSAMLKQMWEFQSTCISEEELLEDCRIAEREKKAGTLRKLRSFDDLDHLS